MPRISKRYNPRAKKMYTYTWSDDNVIVPTPARVLHRIAFKQASQQTAVILSDAEQRAMWQQRFEEQTKRKFFRPFIVGALLAEYKSQLRDELAQHGTLNGQPIDHLFTNHQSSIINHQS